MLREELKLSDIEEINFLELLKLINKAISNGKIPSFENCSLFDERDDSECEIIHCNNDGVEFIDHTGNQQKLMTHIVAKWYVSLPKEHILFSYRDSTQSDSEERGQMVKYFRKNEIPVNFAMPLSLEDLTLIKKCWEIDLADIDKDLRHSCYKIVKKLENFPNFIRDSYRIGRKVLEKWTSPPPIDLPGDVLIHLAYYRRWTKDTEAALEVTNFLKDRKSELKISDQEKAILSTERAAALMDMYDKSGLRALITEALRFLKYSHKLNGGKSTEQNTLCWKRYEKLISD